MDRISRRQGAPVEVICGGLLPTAGGLKLGNPQPPLASGHLDASPAGRCHRGRGILRAAGTGLSGKHPDRRPPEM